MAEKKTTNATGRSKSTTGKQSTKTTTKSRSKKAAELEAQRIREEALRKSEARRRVSSVILFAVGVLLFLIAVIPGGEKDGWRALFNVIHGLFGIGAYAVGPVMVYSAIIIGAKKPKSTVVATVLKMVSFILIFCAAVEIFAVGKVNGENFIDLIKNLYTGGVAFKSGGVFALFLGVPLLFLGKVGAAIIIILVALVCVFLMTNLSLGDAWNKLSTAVSGTGEVVKEKHREAKERSAIANEEYKRMEEERRLARQLEADRKRFQAEIDEEERKKAKLERMKELVDSVDVDPVPVESTAPEVPKAVTPDKTESTEKKPADKPVLAQKAEPVIPTEKKDISEILEQQEEQVQDYREALMQYMMKRHPVMREDEKPEKDMLEDEDAELVPILDALHKFDQEHSAPARVTKVVDAPSVGKLTSDDPIDIDDGELPFDINDILPEPEPTPAPVLREEGPEVPVAAPPVKNTEPTRGEQLKLSDVYTLPPVNLLNPIKARVPQADIDIEIRGNAQKLVDTLKSFGVSTTYTGASRGPSVTRYELQPAPGVKISRITNLSDDIALNLAASGVRIAPIPNKAAVGIEVPNDHRDTVFFRELIDTKDYRSSFDKKLLSVLGKDISGNMVTCNVAKMPHLLIAGTTGSGKSVCVNSIIMSILMKSTPNDVRLLMVDPKQVEFMMYNGIPHLLIPVVTDPKKAAGALAWAVTEMENRYTLFSENNVRNIDGYNELATDPDSGLAKMPSIVIFIDELADLMMASPKDVEDSIVRLAQKARAAGMHLVIATQKPTVQVVTGLIKGNIPSRIALMVASQVDSRVILDQSGAEKLLGNGDMLYMPVGVPKPVRLQGCYVADEEVERVVEFIKQTFAVEYDESIMAEIERQAEIANAGDQKGGADSSDVGGDVDDKLEEAIEMVVNAGTASTSMLQRGLSVGYGRAGRLIDTMEKMGIVGPFVGAKPRQVLMTKQEWYERKLRQ